MKWIFEYILYDFIAFIISINIDTFIFFINKSVCIRFIHLKWKANILFPNANVKCDRFK